MKPNESLVLVTILIIFYWDFIILKCIYRFFGPKIHICKPCVYGWINFIPIEYPQYLWIILTISLSLSIKGVMYNSLGHISCKACVTYMVTEWNGIKVCAPHSKTWQDMRVPSKAIWPSPLEDFPALFYLLAIFASDRRLALVIGILDDKTPLVLRRCEKLVKCRTKSERFELSSLEISFGNSAPFSELGDSSEPSNDSCLKKASPGLV